MAAIGYGSTQDPKYAAIHHDTLILYVVASEQLFFPLQVLTILRLAQLFCRFFGETRGDKRQY